jgi:hypothetical protein
VTGWIPDVVPDQLIESAWGNKIRDRTATPFTNAAERATAIPAPKVGMLTYQIDAARLEVYNGAAWVAAGLPQTWYGYAALGGGISSGGSAFNLLAINPLPAGDYLLTANMSYVAAINTQPQVGARLFRNTAATLLGDQMFSRGAQSTGATTRNAWTVTALSRNDPGGNVIFGVVATTDTAAPIMGPAQITVQRITAMN